MLNNEGDDEHRNREEFNDRFPAADLDAEGESKTLSTLQLPPARLSMHQCMVPQIIIDLTQDERLEIRCWTSADF